MFGRNRNLLARNWSLRDEFSRLQQQLQRVKAGLLRCFPGSFPPMNVWADEETAVVTAEVPGLACEAIEISVAGSMVTLSGEREVQDEGECWHLQERPTGAFSRSVELPFSVDTERVEARTAKGVLRVTLPRAAVDKPRKIEVKAG